MRKVTMTPTGYNGTVEISLLNNLDRMKLFASHEFNIKKNESGSIEASEVKNNASIMAQLMETLKERVGVVDLTKGEQVYKSYDDLLDDPEAMDACVEIIVSILNGIKLGKH